MSKIMKGFFILSLLILTAGALFLVPNSFRGAKAEQNITAIAGDEDTKVGQAGVETTTYGEYKNLLEGIDVETKTITSTSKYGHDKVYTISAKEDLALVAYKVATGGEIASGVSAKTAVYSLEADIDLLGALWTPIGTSSNAFSGTFYGNGHSISNITINDASLDASSSAGLFGNIENASICDIILKGSMVFNTTRTKGALVGSMENSDIINCYDECSKSNASGNSFNSVGSQTSSRVFLGGSHDGMATTYTSQASILATLSVPSDVTKGYVGTYRIADTDSGANFYRANSIWYEPKLVRVLFNGSLSAYTGTVKNNLYQTQVPTLRENASDTNIYPLYAGYKANLTATMASKVSSGYVYDIDFPDEKTTISVNFNHGYGTRTSTTVTAGYDTTFYSILSEKEYLPERLGYRMTDLQNSDKVSMYYKSLDWDYKLSYPTAGATYNFIWEALTNRAFNFQFAIANNEGSGFSEFSNIGSALSGTDLSQFIVNGGNLQTADGTSSYDKLNLKVNSITSGNTVTLKFTLKYGYKISIDTTGDIGAGKTIYSEDSEKAITNFASGVYTNFINTTGEGTSYSVDGKNNDSYNKVTASVTATANASDSNKTDYTVTVNNIVGTNGTVYIIVEREEIEIDLTPYMAGGSDISGVTYTWTLVGATDGILAGVARLEQNTEINSFTLYVKYQENPTLKISVANDQNIIITSIKTANYAGANTSTPIKSDSEFTSNNETYYRTWEFSLGSVTGYNASVDCGKNKCESKACLHVALARLQTKLDVYCYDENSQQITGEDSTALLGVQINVSEIDKEKTSKTINATGQLFGMAQGDVLRVYNNGYYRVSEIVITDLLSNSTVGTIKPSGDRTFNAEETFSGNYFSKVFGYGNSEITNYSVEVCYELRTYSLGFQFDFDNHTETEASNLTDLFTLAVTVNGTEFEGDALATKLQNLNAGDIVAITITFTNKGKAILFVPSSDHFGLVNEGQSSASEGYQVATATTGTQNATGGVYNYSFTVGSYDSTLKFKYEYRKIEIEISKLVIQDTYEVVSMTSPSLQSFNFTYNFSETSDKVSLVGNVSGISIHSQYYLINWYLQNGSVTNCTNFAGFKTNSTIIAKMIEAGASSASGQSFGYTGLQAYVGQRTVTVDANPGAVGAGKFYNSDKTEFTGTVKTIGSVTFNQALSVSDNTFYNLGYSFSSWTPSAGTMANGSYSIFGDNWDSLFGSSSLSQTWTGFASDADKSRTVTLKANWDIITYTVKIDDQSSATIQIGATIYYTSTPANRDGMATYYISTDSQIINGSSEQGYWVSGYDIGFNIGETGEKVNDSNRTENTLFSLTPDNFLSFMIADYYFTANSDANPLEIVTVREEATYKLYLDSISGTSYFSYGVDEEKLAEYGGKDSSNNKYYVNVKYNAKAQELLDAINNGAINISRTGYTQSGWVIANNGVQTSTVFNPNDVYQSSSPTDRYIVPTWNRSSAEAVSNIAFGEDVGTKREFYLTNSHNVLFGDISGSGVKASDSLSIGLILSNGEKVTGFGFRVTFDGKTTDYSGASFNIENFAKAGSAKVQFYIQVEDILEVTANNNNYETLSSEETFTMKENNIFFYDYNLVSVYNGTSEYVPATQEEDGEENDFGKFLYRYDWDGSERTTGATLSAKGATNEFFESFSIEETSFDVGSGKKVRAYLNLNAFGSGYNWSDLFDNVEVDDNGKYYVILDTRVTKGADGYSEWEGGPLEIVRAKITLSFTKGSAYYIDGVTAVVYTNTEVSTFSVGKVTFSYNYSNISLKPNAPYGKYTGSKDYSLDCEKFVVYGLKVNDSIVVTDENGTFKDGNFEWNISEDSEYELLDSANAIKLEYVSKYLLAENGELLKGLEDNYGDSADKLILTSIKVGEESQTLADAKVNNGQFSLFTEENYNGEIIMSIAGNDSAHLYIYVNRDVVSSSKVSFSLALNYVSGHSNIIYPLAWSDSKVETFGSMFDSENAGKESHSVEVSSTQENATTYAILTDAVKVNLDFNGGKLSEELSKSIYVSAGINGDGEYSLANPSYPYDGISFGGYTSPAGTNLTVTTGEGDTTFAVTKGGKAQSLEAMWNFDEIIASLNEENLSRYASENGIELALDDVATITSPELFEKTFNLLINDISYIYSSASGNFTIKNDKGYALPSMGGEAKLTLSFKFNDGVQAPQTATKELAFNFEILINTINVEYNGEELIFNNTDQSEDVLIDFTFNDEAREDNASVSVFNLSRTDDKSAVNGVYVSGNPSLTLKNAGEYVITFKVVTEFAEMYQFENLTQEATLSLTIGKYEIMLKDYVDQIGPSKMFGGADPNPISAEITIEENVNDKVAIAFTRVAGEAIGTYLLTFSDFVNSEDKGNYSVNVEGFEDYFEITTPGGNLKVELDKPFSYIYNGYAISGFAVTYTDGEYSISANAGTQNLAITFDLYYESGSNKVYVPESERVAYAEFITVSSNATAQAGSYSLIISLTDEAKESGWSGIDVVNPANAIVLVNQRVLKVTALEKVFDQTATFVYNNVNSENNTATLTLENVVSVGGTPDEIQISGKISSALVGQVEIMEMAITNSVAKNNYTLDWASISAKVVADSTTEVSATATGETTFDYGKFFQTMTAQQVNALLPVSFNEGAIANEYISITATAVENGTYSTGGYLNKGSYNIALTLTSTNYTFGASREDSLTHEYSTVVKIEISVNPIEITIENSSLNITKVYDGNENVLASFVNQNVNKAGGYYTSSEILDGDVITVISAVYADEKIGEDKAITLSFSDSDDNENYAITQDVVGDITKVNLTFNKNGATITFVDGEKEFANTTAISLDYNGDLDALIQSILDEETFLTRVGYTQTGWKYNGTSLADMTDEEKATLLQSAVDAGSNGITLNAIWEINKYTLTVNAGEHATASVTSQELSYYDSVDSITVVADEGYTFEGISANFPDNATLQVVGSTGNRNGEFSLTHILGNITVTILTEEITVKIILNYNAPTGQTVVTDNATWGALTERVVSYSELSSTDLPVLRMQNAGTYDFAYWTMGTDSQASTGSTIWERIGGAGLTADNTETGFTFKANWSEADLYIKITASENANITVKDSDGQEITKSEDGYLSHYLASVSIEISHKDWYKWTGVSISGTYTEITGNTEATNAKEGAFTLKTVKSEIEITITTEAIKVNFTSSFDANAPYASSVKETNGSITGLYTVDGGMTEMADVINSYTANAGTYEQTAWTSGGKTIALSADPQTAIADIYGSIPTSDISIALVAQFEGLKYTVTFVKGTESANASFTGTDAGKETTTREFVYGSTISDMPVLEHSEGKDYIWRTETAKEIFSNGMIFKTAEANANCTLTITAEWTEIPYEVYVELSTNSDKVTSITYNGVAIESGDYVQVILGANATFTFSFATGYEFDQTATVITTGSGESSLTYNGNDITLVNVMADTTITVAVKAKDYTLTISDSGYETLVKEVYNVSYDEDISNLFSGEISTRSGYTLTGLNVNDGKGTIFASFASNVWTISDSFVENGRYNYDGSLELITVWQYNADAKFITITTSPVENIYYNGSAQTVATSSLVVASGETFALDKTFSNGEKVIDVYYMLGEERATAQGDFSYSHTDYILDGSLYMVAVIKDLLTGTTHVIESTPIEININKTDVVIKNSSIASYYTGSSKIELVNGYSYGSVYFHDNATANAELSISKVELVDDSGKFNKGTGYKAKYYFTPNASFKADNYSGLAYEGGLYTMEVTANAEIREASAVLTVSGKGYDNGRVHKVENASISLADYVENASAQVISVYTTSAVEGIYDESGDFTVVVEIKNASGEDISGNFELSIAGSYSILSKDLAYEIVVGSMYFDGDSVEANTDHIVSVTSVVYSGKTIPVGEMLSYMDGEDLIFSIDQNGTADISILVTKGISLTVNFSLSGDKAVVLWTANPSLDNVKTALNELEEEGEKSYSAVCSQETSLYAVVTDYKAVLQGLGDKGGNQGYVYVKLGSSVTIADPEAWTGFEFASWQVDKGEGISLSGSTLTASKNITSSSIKAIWTLAKPTATTKTFRGTAKFDGSEIEIELDDILTNGIENANSTQITYSYEFLKGTTSLSTQNKFSVDALTSSSGTYTLKITATKKGYVAASQTFDFNVAINGIVLSDVTFGETTFTYENKDFMPEINVTLGGVSADAFTLSELTQTESPYGYFSFAGSEIRNAGEYSLTLNLSDEVFDLEGTDDSLISQTYTITVNKADLEVVQSDIPTSISEKLLGSDDPEFKFSKTVYGEEVEITLTRVAGESQGEYDFLLPTDFTLANYNLSLASGVVFTIKQADVTLTVKFDNAISAEYTGSSHAFDIKYDTTLGKWVVTLGSSESTLSLSYEKGDETIVVSGNLYTIALENIALSLNSAVNAGKYDAEDMTVTGNGNFASYELIGEIEITTKGITLTGITKVFDRTDEIESTSANLSGLVDGDKVSLSGKYNQVTAGTGIKLTNLALAGEDSGNYHIANEDSATGNITPLAITSASITIENTEFEYGQIGLNSNLITMASLVGNVTLSLDGVTDDLANQYVSIVGITCDEDNLSTSKHLEKGSQEITVAFYTVNFTGLSTLNVSITIKAKEIDLSAISSSIVKDIDGNNSLPADLSTNIDSYILAGDKAQIDKDLSHYDDETIASGKKVTIVLKGDDSANYTVKDNVTGTINAFSININVNAEVEDASLVTDGQFVEDGLSPVVNNSSFVLSYPTEKSGEELISTLTLPTRTGYTATGWKYHDGNGYVDLDETNIISVLQNASTLEDKTVEIYTVWEIEYYSISVQGENFTAVVTGQHITGSGTTVIETRYFSDIEVKITGERGYKVKSYILTSGSVNSQTFSAMGQNKATATLEKIASDIVLKGEMEAIKVTFTVDLDLPEYTERTDKNNTSYSFGYTELTDKGEDDIAVFTVTEGTYYLEGLYYNDTDLIGDKSLKEIVDTLYTGELTEDFSVSLKASWKGENYTINFDMNGGSLTNGSLSMTATYGNGITGTFPTVTKTGQKLTWKAPDGTVYIQSDVLKTVGTKNGDGEWELTLKAEWQNETFTLSFVIGEKITVEVDGTSVASGSTRDLVYGETVLSLKVTCQQGYTYNLKTDTFFGTVEGSNGNYTVKDLTANSTLVFEKVCADNTLTLKLANIAEYTVKIDGETSASSLAIVAKTESKVEIQFVAVKGYEFAVQSITFTGNGTLTQTISEDKKTLSIVWKDFTGNGTLTISAIASDNVIEIADTSLYLQTLTVNGQSIDVKGGQVIAKTGTQVTVQGTLKYGYQNGSIATGTIDYVKEGSETNSFSDSDKCFHFSSVLEGFDEGFTITFTAEKRTYMIEVLVADGQSEYGQITAETPQYVEFGGTLSLSQTELRYDYIFDSWRYSESDVVSTNESDEITLDESQKALLESVDHGDSIKVYAYYIKCTIDVTFTSNERGSFDVIQIDVASGEEELLTTVLNGRTEVVEIFMGQDVILKFHGDKGYEVDNVKVNNVAIVLADYGYTEENQTVAIFADMENKITTIDVSFKASALRVTVRAGVQIRYEEVLGVDIGGYFYATDKYGERLDDSVYLENDGKFILGADYQLASVTDKTLYFVVENKGGYTFTVSCEGEATLNEYSYNGKKIYSFIGIKEDITIKAIFVAKENRVKVQFALEGKTDVAYAGTIAVDSSSNLVSASPNRASILDVAVVTSADLKLNVYSSLAYTLAKDENGYLKYRIVYSGNTEYDEVTVGMLTAEDKTTLGYTYSSTMEIKNINSNATIYIYVVPQEYTIKFAVSDTESVTMSEKVRYGEEFNLGSLTLEEFNMVFQTREGFSFTGYYTQPLGHGTQYINGNLEIVSRWLEDGYEFDGTKYVEESNFDSNTNTITLYAGWVYNKAVIEVQFTPSGVANSDASYSITSIITNFDPDRAWTNQYNKWYAEALIGSSLDFKALSFGGYDFVSWEVTFDEGEPVAKPANFTLANVQLGTYVIKAIYNPTYKIVIQNLNNGKNDGGKSYIVQDGKAVTGTSFDKDKLVTLKAEANDGYKFLYWINITTGETYHAVPAGDGTWTYSFTETISTPLDIKAVFTGKTVLVNLDTTQGGAVHDVKEVTINGKTINYSSQFSACVGDEIKVFVTKAQGYGFNFTGAPMFETYDVATGYYVFSYTFRTNELTKVGNETYSINIRFEAPKEKLNLMFNVKVDEPVDSNEFSKAGKLVFKNASGQEMDVSANTEYTITYGDSTILTIKAGENYRLAYVYLKNPSANEITAWVVDGKLIIDQDFIQNYFAKSITIDVYFERIVWSMEEFRADTFAGAGSEERPYLISTEEEFALVAYLVNNGIGDYANAYYKLTASLDFKGKYWEPIGTEENKFNGTFDLGRYSIENVTHYTVYTNPKTSYSGLFWHLGDDAKIIQDNSTVVTIIGIIIGLILLIALIILIIIIVRKKKKRNIDRLADL